MQQTTSLSFSEKIRNGISYELSAQQTIHINFENKQKLSQDSIARLNSACSSYDMT